MESSSWLPPLNSHSRYEVYVKATQPNKSLSNPSLLLREFSIKIKISVNFYSENKHIKERSRMFEGLSTAYEFSILCGQIALDCVNSWEIIASMLSKCCIPFDFDGAIWIGRQLEDVSRDLRLSDNCDLVEKILEFLCRMNSEEYNLGKKKLPFKLEIEKMVEIPDEELKAWNSWYDEKKRRQLNFERDFRKAIQRPRTYEEWMSETQINAFKGASRSSIRNLEEMKFNGWTSKNRGNCSICIEEFMEGSQGIRLPCSHIFHNDCIMKWLQDSHVCPLCRFMFPTDCHDCCFGTE